jgi:hypothetical protein
MGLTQGEIQQDEVGFLLANFCHIMGNHEKPFIFPSQA